MLRKVCLGTTATLLGGFVGSGFNFIKSSLQANYVAQNFQPTDTAATDYGNDLIDYFLSSTFLGVDAAAFAVMAAAIYLAYEYGKSSSPAPIAPLAAPVVEPEVREDDLIVQLNDVDDEEADMDADVQREGVYGPLDPGVAEEDALVEGEEGRPYRAPRP